MIKSTIGMGDISKAEGLYLQKNQDKTNTDIIKIDDKIELNKLKKRNEQLLKALKSGARIAEISCSKLLWDIGHGRLEVTQGKLDYRTLQVLDCAADLIAQEYWFASVFDSSIKANTKEPDHFYVPISYQEFIHFIGDKGTLSTKDVMKIFGKMPKITLHGITKIPSVEKQWSTFVGYEDNICGVIYAWDEENFGKYRSKRRMRDKDKKEEPVFVLEFSNRYGKAFFRNAMYRDGRTQLQEVRLYKLRSEAQMLFQGIRWKDIFKNKMVKINIEQASRMMDLTWPIQGTGFYKRVGLIRKVLQILKDERFIDYNNKTYEFGKKINRKAWRFHIIRRGFFKSLVKK